MPKAPPRECSAPRCAKYAVANGRCEAHQVKRKAWITSEGKTKQERGYGRSWERIRNAVLIRDDYLCQPCLRLGYITKAQEVDHILCKAKGGDDSDSNLQSICTPCHKKKTAEDRRP